MNTRLREEGANFNALKRMYRTFRGISQVLSVEHKCEANAGDVVCADWVWNRAGQLWVAPAD